MKDSIVLLVLIPADRASEKVSGEASVAKSTFSSSSYREGWERIFAKKDEKDQRLN